MGNVGSSNFESLNILGKSKIFQPLFMSLEEHFNNDITVIVKAQNAISYDACVQ